MRRLASVLLVVALAGCGDVVVMKYGVDACFAWTPPLAARGVLEAVAKACGEGK